MRPQVLQPHVLESAPLTRGEAFRTAVSEARPSSQPLGPRNMSPQCLPHLFPWSGFGIRGLG